MSGSSLVLSVSQLNFYVKSLLDDDPKLRQFLIRGEISNFTHHSKTGHFYFTLKDERAAVKAVMFRTYSSQVKFAPQNGMKVVASCSLSVYERDGVYQLYVYDLMPDGVGSLSLAFEQRKEKLAAQGLFDAAHKRPIPEFPSVVGVVTSEQGAALRDILNILGRRNPLATVRLAPAAVQGEGAAAELTAALKRLDSEGKCDVILLGRGGGSMEDLWAFNDEELARAVFASKAPVISAVGHETDYTICDFVADLRAPTPSAAAELCSIDARESLATLKAAWQLKGGRLWERLERAEERITALGERLEQAGPAQRVARSGEAVALLKSRIDAATGRRLEQAAGQVAASARLLEAYSPLKTVSRGYAVVRRGGEVVPDGQTLCPGDRITLQMRDALVEAKVERIEKVEQGGVLCEKETYI